MNQIQNKCIKKDLDKESHNYGFYHQIYEVLFVSSYLYTERTCNTLLSNNTCIQILYVQIYVTNISKKK